MTNLPSLVKRIDKILLLSFAVFIVALLVRLVLTPLAFHGDLLSQAGWGSWIHDHGLLGFYDNNKWIYGWPSHPPIISALYGFGFVLYDALNTIFVWIGQFIALHRLAPTHFFFWFQFVAWFGHAFYSDTPFKFGQLMTMKFLPIIADLIVGLIVYKFASEKFGRMQSLGFASLYLFSPFSWYLSGIWGQTDQLGFLLLLASFLLLYKNYSILAVPIFAIDIGIKPTILIFLPLFLWISLRNGKRSIALNVVGWGIAALLFLLMARFFSHQPVYNFAMQVKDMVFSKGEVWIGVNSFNFWNIFYTDRTGFDTTFLLLPIKFWGMLLFAVCNIFAFAIYKRGLVVSLVTSLFVVAYGGWLFFPTMHERYFYSAVVLGSLLSIYYPKLLKYWFVMSIIFAINLYHGWWFPESLNFLKQLLTWQNDIVVRLLSLVNVVLFFRILFLLGIFKRPSLQSKKLPL